jgi:hypothetical protein
MMTLINRSPLLRNSQVNNVSVGAVTSCNSEVIVRSGVFYTVLHEAATLQRDVMPRHTSTEEVFSVWSVLRLYKRLSLSSESVESLP